ncbi:hypothetical protein MHBO_002235 [Bonamia ostreae]|uniref:Preprotein translocase subunit SecY n=1 Tax=Bonamia ostreae TaxID=126728 RepID=A0ABV2ALM7_9EUKA
MHFLLHVFLIALLCGVFSMLWMEASGSSPKSQARMLDSQGIQFYKKSRKETLPTIEKNVFPSTILGGVAVGILTVLSQITGALMSGTGIFMTVNLIFSYYQLYRKEKN